MAISKRKLGVVLVVVLVVVLDASAHSAVKRADCSAIVFRYSDSEASWRGFDFEDEDDDEYEDEN